MATVNGGKLSTITGNTFTVLVGMSPTQPTFLVVGERVPMYGVQPVGE